MDGYRHRQVATLVYVSLGIPILAIAAVLATVEFDAVALAVLVLLLIAVILFGSLSIEVTPTLVRLRFGPGLVQREFALSELRRVSVVRNRWYFGWGIRRLPNGWLYNVSGLGAVELEMADGQVHRIGTDRPDELSAAIDAARRMGSPAPR
jgi:hypothetical protein